MDIQNVVALVTGAGSGLGLATCQALVAAGAQVMAVDVDEERLVNNVLPLGSGVCIQRVDVSNDAEVKSAGPLCGAGLWVPAGGRELCRHSWAVQDLEQRRIVSPFAVEPGDCRQPHGHV